MESLDSISKDANRWKVFGIAAIIVVIAWSTSWFLLVRFLPDWGDRGTFGDMFGAINALFSGLAFAGVIYTIWLQTKELALQRQELEATREELRRSADAQEETKLALNQQVHLQALSTAISAHSSIVEQQTHTSASGRKSVSGLGDESQKQVTVLLEKLTKLLEASEEGND